jgi:hypothetical protein
MKNHVPQSVGDIGKNKIIFNQFTGKIQTSTTEHYKQCLQIV